MPDIVGRIIQIPRPFASFSGSGFAVVATDSWYADEADTAEEASRSGIVIYEDNTRLGPTTSREDIASKGHGRFSHRRDNDKSLFVFSSTDNTDPRTNGRSYWAVRPGVRAYAVPKGKIVVRMRKPFETFRGSHMAVDHTLDRLTEFADDRDNYYGSPVQLYEDDRPLGPPHSPHTDIIALGRGRYSHWKPQGMVFSSSDNSNPNTNGRQYWAVLPEAPGR